MSEAETIATEFIRRIANEARSVITDSTARMLVLAWAGDGVCSANVFHEQLADNTVRFHFGTTCLMELVSAFREIPTSLHPQLWSGFALAIDDDDFSIEFFYQKIDDSFDPLEFRNRHVHSHFGDLPIKYPQRG